LGDDGIFRDREGLALGRLTSVTIELDESPQNAAESMGLWGKSSVGEKQTSLIESVAKDGGPGETNADLPDPADDVWRHYVEVMKPRKPELPPAERKLIRDALKVAEPNELKKAISGCASSDFHMGHNDRKRKYNSLSQIIKGRQGRETTRERIDYFIDLADKSGVVRDGSNFDLSRVPSVMRATVNSQRGQVRRGLTSDDEHAQRMGREAAEWLRERYKIVPVIENGELKGWRYED
jgi:hypothetical protein